MKFSRKIHPSGLWLFAAVFIAAMARLSFANAQTTGSLLEHDYRNLRDGGRGQLRNRTMMGEGAGAIEFEQLGNTSNWLQSALLQSVPPSAEKEPVNTVFPAWPKGWDAQFTLAARGAFLISASMQSDQIEFVEILSEKGGQCILQNPWPAEDVTVYRNDQVAEGVSGKLLTLSTTAGERLDLVPKGKVPTAKILR